MKILTPITTELRYSSPHVAVIEMESETIICTSTGGNIADDENNTGSASGFPWDD